MKNGRRAALGFTISMGLITAALLIQWQLLKPDAYQAFAAGVQAFVVVAALLIALSTLRADSRDRRIDRVIQLSEALTSGEIEEARRRLGRHLWHHGASVGRARDVSLKELDDDPAMSQYGSSYEPEFATRRPRDDARIILRFMERANAARLGSAVDEALFHELVGRHAVWYAVAIGKDRLAASYVLAPLLELADWANSYQQSRSGSSRTYMANWGEARIRAFGRLV